MVLQVMGSVTGTTVPPNSIIVMSGIAKVYCGEVIETARVVQEEWKEKDKEKGQLLPKHFREAVRRLRQRAPYTVTGAPPPRGHLT
jgi:transcription initiation factor TFIID subunit 11